MKRITTFLIVFTVIGNILVHTSIINGMAYAGDEPTIWKCGSTAIISEGVNHPVWQMLIFLNEKITAATEGRYKLELYHSGQLGGERDTLEGVSNGIYKFGVVMNSYICNISDVFNVFELPYLFTSYEHFLKVLRSDIVTDIGATLESHNLVCLGMGVNGLFSLSNNKLPVTKPEDLQNLKIRTMDSPVQIETINFLGGKAIPMNWTEVYTGLQQKTVDGVSAPIAGMYGSKLYEVQKYATQLRMFVVPSVIIVNKPYWEKLPKEDREKIQQAVKDALELHFPDALAQDLDQARRCQETGKMSVIGPEDYDNNAFIEKVQPIHDKYKDKYGIWIERITKMK
jgi:tripartite ATP-independent transporter DctP family solute receptor